MRLSVRSGALWTARPAGSGSAARLCTVRRRTAELSEPQLCRFHHRLKTIGDWTYHLTHDTVLTWTSPLGRRYTVDETGTRPHDV